MKVSWLRQEELSDGEARAWAREMQMIVRPIVIVSTISKEGIPNAALKTNFMIVSALKEVLLDVFQTMTLTETLLRPESLW